MYGAPGAWNELTASVDKFVAAIGKSGVIEDAAKAMTKLADAVDALSKSNPTLLRFGTHAAVAVAAMAPLGLAASGVATALGLAGGAIGLVVSPLGFAAAAIVALGAAVWFQWPQIVTGFGKVRERSQTSTGAFVAPGRPWA